MASQNVLLVQAAADAGVPIPPPSLSMSQGGDGSEAAQPGDRDPYAVASKCADQLFADAVCWLTP